MLPDACTFSAGGHAREELAAGKTLPAADTAAPRHLLLDLAVRDGAGLFNATQRLAQPGHWEVHGWQVPAANNCPAGEGSAPLADCSQLRGHLAEACVKVEALTLCREAAGGL